MTSDIKTLAIVMARSGSKGLPHKNIKLMADHPLLAWPIMAAKSSLVVNRTILSTDSEDYAEIGRKYGAEVPFLRPPELATDQTKSIDVVLDLITRLEQNNESYDYVIMLEPTSPLTEGSDILKALNLLHQHRDVADSIVGISKTESQNPIFTVLKNDQGVIYPREASDFSNLPRRQDIEDVFFLEGSLYMSDVNSLKIKRSFYHERTMGLEMPKWKSFEVDDIVDFICIESLLKNKTLFKT